MQSSNKHDLSCQPATTAQHGDVQEAEPQVRNVYVQTIPHTQSQRLYIKNPSIGESMTAICSSLKKNLTMNEWMNCLADLYCTGVQASPLSLYDRFIQTEDRLPQLIQCHHNRGLSAPRQDMMLMHQTSIYTGGRSPIF